LSRASVLQGLGGIVAGVQSISRKGRAMTVHTSIAVPARQRHTRFAVLAAALVAAAIVTAVAVALATGSSHKSAGSGRLSPASTPQAHYNSAAMDSIMALTPARFAAGALGSGYALSVKQTGPTLASILASMSPQTRRYTEAVMALTFTQLKAGAAGSP
jgi:hypothetical protein